MEFWRSVTLPQATIVAAIFTVGAAVLGVSLGAWLFGGRVKTLEGALERTEELVQSHKSAVERELTEIQSKVEGLSSALLVASGQIRAEIADSEVVNEPESQSGAQVASREKLQADWNAIRDVLEERAAQPTIDGRTRARYSRLDRRRYADLVEALAHDKRLGAAAPAFLEAVSIWQRYRSGRRSPGEADGRRMSALREQLAATPLT